LTRRIAVGNFVKRRQNSRREPPAGDHNLPVHTIVTAALPAAFTALAIAFLASGPAPRGITRDRHAHHQRHALTQT
jgi:hypothetical protein